MPTDSNKIIWHAAKAVLQEESSLKSTVDLLKAELETVKKELFEAKEQDMKSDSLNICMKQIFSRKQTLSATAKRLKW